jgi:methyl-accepting chemotaxis protein
VREIDQMIQQTRSKVERIVSNAQEKGRTGTLTSEQFTAAWDEMAKHMGSVHETVKQLTQISSEQTREIHDLKQGLAEVDQMTHQQSVSAEKLTGTFQEFLTRVQRIRSFVRNLILMIGASDERSTPSHSDHEPS